MRGPGGVGQGKEEREHVGEDKGEGVNCQVVV